MYKRWENLFIVSDEDNDDIFKCKMYWKNLFETKALILDGALWCGKSPEKCLKLSNSGNILKLLVPNDGLNAICVWETTYSLNINKFNNSCKVISHMMIEREIDYRVYKSKDDCKTTPFVKEQRVDGSWQEKYNTLLPSRCLHSCLRYTLMGFERNCPGVVFYPVVKHKGAILLVSCQICVSYQNNLIKIPSKQLVKYFCSSSLKLNLWFVTGFTDAYYQSPTKFHSTIQKKLGGLFYNQCLRVHH